MDICLITAKTIGSHVQSGYSFMERVRTMAKVNNFFFSKILHKKINNPSGSVLGKLNDLVFDFTTEKPTVKAVEIKNGRHVSYILPNSLVIRKDEQENLQVNLDSNNVVFIQTSEDDIFLGKNFLDKQIVDINGKKVERVNDVRLGLIHDKWMLVAVDIGFRGLLRRLGLEYAGIRVTKLLKREFRNKLIYWSNVQPLNTGAENLKLSTALTKLETLHAADIADIIEELDKNSRINIFKGLAEDIAAEVFEEIEDEVQMNLLDELSDEKASNILESMPPDEAADVLGHIDESRAEKLLVQMEHESSEEIRELMDYEENTIGSIMSVEYLTFLPDKSVTEVCSYIRQETPDDEDVRYIYIVNSRNRLLGYVNLLDLIVAGEDKKLYDLMYPNIVALLDEDKITKGFELLQKYNLPYAPVVDNKNELIGLVSLNDLIREILQ